MITLDFEFSAVLWEYIGNGSWHFLTVPKHISADIKAFTRDSSHGFRTLRTSVLIGETKWLTSLFPDKKSGCYFLPIKASIRKSENLRKGEDVFVKFEIFI